MQGKDRQGLGGLKKEDVTAFLVYHRIIPATRLGSYLTQSNILPVLYKFLQYEELIAVTSTCTSLRIGLKEISKEVWQHYYAYYEKLLTGMRSGGSICWELLIYYRCRARH